MLKNLPYMVITILTYKLYAYDKVFSMVLMILLIAYCGALDKL